MLIVGVCACATAFRLSALPKVSSLQMLYLMSNSIGDEGEAALKAQERDGSRDDVYRKIVGTQTCQFWG